MGTPFPFPSRHVPFVFLSCYVSPMARLARVIVPGLPHHVTQRGNRREPIFFEDGDQRFIAASWPSAARRGVEVWAYCLMPNHVQR